jgi:hypothetical protein
LDFTINFSGRLRTLQFEHFTSIYMEEVENENIIN